jgi:hypothetical protein
MQKRILTCCQEKQGYIQECRLVESSNICSIMIKYFRFSSSWNESKCFECLLILLNNRPRQANQEIVQDVEHSPITDDSYSPIDILRSLPRFVLENLLVRQYQLHRIC